MISLPRWKQLMQQQDINYEYRIIGRAREGRRRIASAATGIGNVKPFELKASIGDGATANSATPFIEAIVDRHAAPPMVIRISQLRM
jgi:hypothetical protein